MSMDWASTKLVFRQVHPHHWDGQNPNSVAFHPTPKDDDKLSVDDSGLTSAENAWIHFTRNLGFQSAGTWAVSPDEIEALGDLELQRNPITDSVDPSKDNLAHCVIDFSRVSSKGQRKRRAQELAIKASARGCQFPSPK
jgi:hypothetical protein